MADQDKKPVRFGNLIAGATEKKPDPMKPSENTRKEKADPMLSRRQPANTETGDTAVVDNKPAAVTPSAVNKHETLISKLRLDVDKISSDVKLNIKSIEVHQVQLKKINERLEGLSKKFTDFSTTMNKDIKEIQRRLGEDRTSTNFHKGLLKQPEAPGGNDSGPGFGVPDFDWRRSTRKAPRGPRSPSAKSFLRKYGPTALKGAGAGLAMYGADYLAGEAFGLGQGPVDTDQDNQNWSNMGMFQKFGSAMTRGTEHAVGMVAPNLANSMRNSRIHMETAMALRQGKFGKAATPGFIPGFGTGNMPTPTPYTPQNMGFGRPGHPSPTSAYGSPVYQQMQAGRGQPSFQDMYYRQKIEDQKKRFLMFGALPEEGFAFLPGNQGLLGSPAAVRARGAMPYSGGGSYSAPSYSSPSYSAPSYSSPPSIPVPVLRNRSGGVTYNPPARLGGPMPPPTTGSAPQQPQAPASIQPAGQGNPLQQQRARFAQELSSNPALRERVMALALAETGNSSSANRGLMETMMNRATAYNQNLSHRNFGEAYYEPMMKGAGPYNRALAQVRNNTQLRARLEGDLQAVLDGSNYSNYGTQNSSAGVAASARRNQTITRDGNNREDRSITNGETWSRKDRPEFANIHGAGIIKKERGWYENTSKAMREWEARQNGSNIAIQPPVQGNKAGGVTGPQGQTQIDPQTGKRFLVLPGMGGTYGSGGKETFNKMTALMGGTPDYLDGKWGPANAKSPMIKAVLDKLSKNDYDGIIGFSAGGYIARHVLNSDEFKKLPQDKQDRIKQVISMGTPGIGSFDSKFNAKTYGDLTKDHLATPDGVLKLMQQQAQQQGQAPGPQPVAARSLANLMKTGGPDSQGDARTTSGEGILRGPAVAQYAPRSTGMRMGLNSTEALIKQGLNPHLAESVFEGAKIAFGDPNDPRTRYVVQVGNAMRPGDGGSKHSQGKAADVQIFDRQTGKLVGGDMGGQSIFKNAFNNPKTYRMYEVFNQGQYKYLYDKYGEKEANRLTSGNNFRAGRSGDLGMAEYRKFANPKIDNMHTSFDEHGQYGSVRGGLNDKPGKGKLVKDWIAKHGGDPSQPMGDPAKWKSPYHPDNVKGGSNAAPADVTTADINKQMQPQPQKPPAARRDQWWMDDNDPAKNYTRDDFRRLGDELGLKDKENSSTHIKGRPGAESFHNYSMDYYLGKDYNAYPMKHDDGRVATSADPYHIVDKRGGDFSELDKLRQPFRVPEDPYGRFLGIPYNKQFNPFKGNWDLNPFAPKSEPKKDMTDPFYDGKPTDDPNVRRILGVPINRDFPFKSLDPNPHTNMPDNTPKRVDEPKTAAPGSPFGTEPFGVPVDPNLGQGAYTPPPSQQPQAAPGNPMGTEPFAHPILPDEQTSPFADSDQGYAANKGFVSDADNDPGVTGTGTDANAPKAQAPVERAPQGTDSFPSNNNEKRNESPSDSGAGGGEGFRCWV